MGLTGKEFKFSSVTMTSEINNRLHSVVAHVKFGNALGLLLPNFILAQKIFHITQIEYNQNISKFVKEVKVRKFEENSQKIFKVENFLESFII